MGLDGFSMANLGLHRDLTSAQIASNTEESAKKGTEIKIKDVTNLAERNGIERKEGDGNAGGGGFSGKKKQQEEEDSQESKITEEFLEQHNPKEFSVRINPNTEMIELFNNKTKKIIETISAQDLMMLISKMESASGVLVNRKI